MNDKLKQAIQLLTEVLAEKPVKNDALEYLNKMGHKMEVLYETDTEIVYGSTWDNCEKLDKSQRDLIYQQVVDLAKEHGFELMDGGTYLERLFYQLKNTSGWAWLKTPEDLLKTGRAFFGDNVGIIKSGANLHNARGSFCAALRVKKPSI